MIKKTLQNSLLGTAMSMAVMMQYVFAKDVQITTEYEISFQDVFEDALSKSNEYKALQQEILSSNELLDKENKYFYPTVTLATELKEFYGSPEPDPSNQGELTLNLNAKIYGSGVSQRIEAAQKNLSSGQLNLKQIELEIYYVVLKFLTKIERTRFYKIQADGLRAELESYYRKQLRATKEGISSQSNAMEVELNKVRFEEAVFGVVSNIDKYFKELREEIGYKISEQYDKNRIGINYSKVVSILEQQLIAFDINVMISLNQGLMAELQLVEASMHSAQAQRERFTVTLSTENYLTMYGGNANNFQGNTDKSFIALKFEYDLFNQQAASGQKSSIHLYLAEKEKYLQKLEQFKAKFESLIFKYDTLMKQRKATIAQIALNRSLIENQKKEILIDKITYLDVVESMSSFNQAQIGLMNLELNLYDVIYQMMTMKSEKIFY